MVCYGNGMAPPKKANARTEFVSLRLTPQEAADIDALQAKHGLRSRSDAVRYAVSKAVGRTSGRTSGKGRTK